MKLEALHLSCGYGTTEVVADASFCLASGEVLCLLGPNGVGKTTLFKAILGFLPLNRGEIRLEGKSIAAMSHKRLATLLGYVPQLHEPPFPFEVLDVVVMGGIGRLKPFASPSKERYQQAEHTLETLGAAYLRNRIYTQISGGERQMVLIARALMQEPKFLVMDEPTSNLDFGNQLRVLSQIERMAAEGVGIIMTSHFPDHAFLCGTKVALMSRTRPFQVGHADAIITEETLREAYGVSVRIASIEDSQAGIIKTCLPRLHVVAAAGA